MMQCFGLVVQQPRGAKKQITCAALWRIPLERTVAFIHLLYHNIIYHIAIVSMTTRYLLHFVHEHVPFRWPEFTAVASKYGLKFELVSPKEHLVARPFILIDLCEDNEIEREKLTKSVKDCYLLKCVIELWAQSNKSVEDLANKVGQTPFISDKRFTDPSQTFRVDVESFGSKIKQSSKIEWIKKMHFLGQFRSKPDLTNPVQSYCICAMHRLDPSTQLATLTDCYFGRVLVQGDRSSVKKFSLKDRKFIANTSMDPLLSLITANTAKIRPNDLVYDPFVGSGGLLLAAAHKGAYVFGADIDWLLLHGKSRPSRIGQKARFDDENVRANFTQYNVASQYIDVLVSDISRSPWSNSMTLDAIIADPPYGVRESSEKIGSKRPRQIREGVLRYPAKISYTMEEMLSDLLFFSAKHLKKGGRLAYYLPVVIKFPSDCQKFADYIPKHPCLELLSYSEQKMTISNYRLLVVMEKVREPQGKDEICLPNSISYNNFREVYFSKSCDSR